KGGRGDVKMRSRRRTHHSHVAWSGSDEEFQSQTPRPAWDAAWDRVRAERKQAGLPNTYGAIGFVLALFYGGQQSQRDDAPTRLLDPTAMGTGTMLTRRVSMESPDVTRSAGYSWPA